MLLVLSLIGCVAPPEYVECDGPKVCQETFGIASTCLDDGFCGTWELPARCPTTTPSDLLTVDPQPKLGETIVIATLMDASEDAFEQQAAMLPLIELAESDSGPGNIPVAAIHCTYEESDDFDSLSREDAAIELAAFLAVDVQPPAIVGPNSSAIANVVFNQFQAAGFTPLMVSPSATSSELTVIDGPSSDKSDENPGLFWRTASPDDGQARSIANDIFGELALTKVAVINESGAYGEGLAQSFKSEFEGLGGTATLYNFDGSGALAAQVATVAELDDTEAPAVLFISSQISEARSFVQIAAADSTGSFDAKILFFTDGAADSRLIEFDLAAGDVDPTRLFPNIRGTRPVLPTGAVYNSFNNLYRAEFGGDASDSAWTAHAYDATWLAIYGIDWAAANEASVGPIEAARGLRQISEGDQTTVGVFGFADVQASFATATSVDLVGASGTLDYDSFTEETSAPVELWSVNTTGDGFDAIGQCAPNGVCTYP